MAKAAAGDSEASGGNRSVTDGSGTVRPDTLRIAVRVKPGASRTRVGGVYSGGVYSSGAHGDDGALIVAVRERAVDGKATEAALRALARALGVPRRCVTLVAGAASRDKLVSVEGPPNGLIGRLAALREG